MQALPASPPRHTRSRENISCAALAAKWGVEAVGRDFPLLLSHAGHAIAGRMVRYPERGPLQGYRGPSSGA